MASKLWLRGMVVYFGVCCLAFGLYVAAHPNDTVTPTAVGVVMAVVYLPLSAMMVGESLARRRESRADWAQWNASLKARTLVELSGVTTQPQRSRLLDDGAQIYEAAKQRALQEAADRDKSRTVRRIQQELIDLLALP